MRVVDYFAALDLPRRTDLDREAIEARYLDRSREVHPDRFAGASAAEQRAAMEQASLLNEAYRALRDPVRRAEHLCKLGGVDLDLTGPGGAPDPGQAFLVEMVELREDLEAAEARGAAAVDELREAIEGRERAARKAAFAAIDRGAIGEAARHLVILRYLRRFLDEQAGDALA